MRRVCAGEIVHITDYGDAEIAATFASPYDAMECGFCEPMGEIQNWKIVGMCREGKRPLFAACRDEENLIESITNDTRIKLIESRRNTPCFSYGDIRRVPRICASN